jgi:hypothetical protein
MDAAALAVGAFKEEMSAHLGDVGRDARIDRRR